MQKRWRQLVILLVSLACASSGSGSAGATDPLDVERGHMRLSLAREQAVRQSLDRGSLATLFDLPQAVREARALRPRAETPLTVPRADVQDIVRAGRLPLSVATPIAALRHAVTRAALRVPAIPSAEVRRRATLVSAAGRRNRPADAPAFDVAPSIEAAAELARALDRHVPLLRAGVRDRRAEASFGSTAAAACDVIDQRPVLCVSSEASHDGAPKAMLVVDLGGDDSYEGAGVAPFLLPGTDLNSMISVVVDVSGSDVHRAAPWPAGTSGSLVEGWHGGAGSGGVGGVAIVLDGEGDDVYEADASFGAGETASVIAQGAGLAGVGILADLDGDDTYRATVGTATVTSGRGLLFAQGAGGFCFWQEESYMPYASIGCGVGALVDSGEGSDTYLASAGEVSVDDYLQFTVTAQGATSGLFFGVLLDDGGPADEFTARLRVAAREDPRTSNWPRIAILTAQGAGDATGILGTGSGRTHYAATLASEGYVLNEMSAQGQSSGGVAILSDGGGDDRYDVESTLRHDMDVRSAGAEDDVRVVAHTDDSMNRMFAQGSTGQRHLLTGSYALLRDAAGDDVYTARNEQSFTVRGHAEWNGGNLRVAGYALGSTRVQGAGVLADATLLDDVGRDMYHARIENSVTAMAPEAPGSTVVAIAATNAIPSEIEAQGTGGSGRLLDLGGDGDRFHAELDVLARAPDARNAFVRDLPWPKFQGAAGGKLLALGARPTLTSTPSTPICSLAPGHRGFGTWFECDPSPTGDGERQRVAGRHGGLGEAPHGVGAGPTFTIDALDAPARAAAAPAGYDLHPLLAALGPGVPRAVARGRLTDAAGEPLAFQPLDARLEYLSDDSGWLTLWSVQAVTDVDGLYEAVLPALVPAPVWRPSGVYMRVHTSFAGGPGLLPRHATSRSFQRGP